MLLSFDDRKGKARDCQHLQDMTFESSGAGYLSDIGLDVLER
jgi:hypothetical protein